MSLTNFLLVAVLFLVALYIRVYNITQPAYVCWDETHFGKMAGSYINRTFFFDVHPPLGKLIIAFTGDLSGYDGNYSFNQPGDSYFTDDGKLLVPYIHLRVLCALFGALTMPICFYIAYIITNCKTASLISALVIIFDVGFVTLSRFILLDSILIFFVTFSILSTLKTTSYQGSLSKRSMPIHCSENDKSFSWKWWMWLISTGVNLGCAISVKFVGIFTVVFIGLWTLFDLWNILGNLNISILKCFQHFCARVIGLIIVPLCVYMFIFYIHFAVLIYSGSGVDFYSSTFQSTLKGNPMHNLNIPKFVQSNSTITIKSKSLQSVFLHSHQDLYPDTKYYQVTGYAVRDNNNLWIMRHISDKTNNSLQHGDQVYITHNNIGKLLSTVYMEESMWHSSFLTKRHLLVTTVDSDYHILGNTWKIELISKSSNENSAGLCTLNCFFKIYNVEAKCYLHSSEKTLPAWGWHQNEITCTRELRDSENCIWFVENSNSPNISDTHATIPSVSFLSKFVESHYVMFGLNSRLLPKPGERISNPWYWPINFKGQLFCKQEDHFRLVGTKLIWYANIICLLVFVMYYLFLSILQARNEKFELRVVKCIIKKNSKAISNELSNLSGCCWCILAWFLHYIPFLFMSRVIFFHHYFVAHTFMCMFFSMFIAHFITKFKSIQCTLIVLLVSILFHNFVSHMHYAYGNL